MFNFYSVVQCFIKRNNGRRVREHHIRGSPHFSNKHVTLPATFRTRT